MREKVINEETRKSLAAAKNQLMVDAEASFGRIFLEKTGLKIGDVVPCHFGISTGTSKQSYRTSTIADGVITRKENGVIVVESVQPLTQGYSTSNRRTGRSYKSWWEYRQEKTISDLFQIQ